MKWDPRSKLAGTVAATASGLITMGAGGLATPPTTIIATATTLTTSSPYTIIVNATAAATVALPQAPSSGRIFWIKNVTANAVTISVALSGTIDGASNYSLSTQYKYAEFIYGGTSGAWYVKGDD